MHLFYTPDILSEHYTLCEEESKHCIKVLRLQAGDLVVLVDGRGGLYEAEIMDPNPKKTTVKVITTQRNYAKRNHYLHLALAPTKHIERIEWFLEKSTEVGIDEISLFICDQSERKEVKIDRLNKVITAAVKQSIKAYHPKLNPLTHFKKFIKETTASQKFIAYCAPDEKKVLKDQIQYRSDYIILIGPEGDFTSEEILLAKNTGYIPISLGNKRLRTETAGLEACFEINFLNQ